MARTLLDLTPTDFENLTFDLLQLMGMDNLVWRTPGADGGRDIEGVAREADFSGGVASQRWYVECKRYSSSVDWPTLWKKLAYADAAGVDFLLLVTNSNPSPQCESEITKWNDRRGEVQLRVWRGYDLDHILRSYPVIAIKYGLMDSPDISPQLLPLLKSLMKISQSNFVGHSLGTDIEPGLEAAAAVAELISLRSEEFQQFGRFVPGAACSEPPQYDWLTWSGSPGIWDESGLRAVITMFRYLTGAAAVKFDATQSVSSMRAVGARCNLQGPALMLIREVAVCSRVEIQGVDGTGLVAHLSPQTS